MRRSKIGWFLASALGFLAALDGLTGCHHARPEQGTGRASFRFIEEPRPSTASRGSATIETAEPREVRVPAEAILPLATPIYPRIAAADRAGWTTIAVRVTVDDQGNVTDIGPSLLGFTTPSIFAADFTAAVHAAVRQWKFRPAEVRQVRPLTLKNGEVLQKVIRIERVETAFDVSFTFTAAGEVTRLPPQ
jgi:hypothetical protein